MNQAFDASIPVLTEIMRDDAAAQAPAPAANAPLAMPIAVGGAAGAACPAGAAGAAGGAARDDAAGWPAQARRGAERVLHQLASRVDFVLEQRIKDSIAEVLDHALHSLTLEIRDGLHDTIGKIVARAVQQEITHLQASSSRRT